MGPSLGTVRYNGDKVQGVTGTTSALLLITDEFMVVTTTWNKGCLVPCAQPGLEVMSDRFQQTAADVIVDMSINESAMSINDNQ